MRSRWFLLGWLAAAAPCPAQMPGVVIEVGLDNFVVYHADTVDRSNWGRLAGPAPPAAAPVAWAGTIGIADIVSVNGKPAKGLWLLRQTGLNLRPSPTPGQAISDVNRGAYFDLTDEFLQEDGTAVGSIMISGLFAGGRPPGAPVDFPGTNAAIIGGTGAFLGMHGQVSGITTPAGARAIRQASINEDPANRRSLGGGNRGAFLHLIPMQRPEITALLHSDFSPVTESSPARAGETLIARASGLGPTRPGVDPGQPFAESPLQDVNSPIEVLVGGRPAAVVASAGWPGTIGGYRVDFRVPEGTGPGNTAVRISAAWIPGPDYVAPFR